MDFVIIAHATDSKYFESEQLQSLPEVDLKSGYYKEKAPVPVKFIIDLDHWHRQACKVTHSVDVNMYTKSIVPTI